MEPPRKKLWAAWSLFAVSIVVFTIIAAWNDQKLKVYQTIFNQEHLCRRRSKRPRHQEAAGRHH
jgi:hypothetical protein